MSLLKGYSKIYLTSFNTQKSLGSGIVVPDDSEIKFTGIKEALTYFYNRDKDVLQKECYKSSGEFSVQLFTVK